MSGRITLRTSKLNEIVIKKITLEWIFIWILIAFSFVNTTTLLASLVLLLFLLQQRDIGAIKILNIITLRTIINPGLGVDIGSVQNLKWGIIFFCSFYLILQYMRTDKKTKIKLKSILISLLFYGMYSIITSFFTSTLPTIAIFKVLSYLIVFIGVLMGVSLTYERFNWLSWINTLFMGIFILSILLIFNPVGYLRNGHSFQGITNQPNMLGILLSLYFALLLTRLKGKKVNNSLLSYIILGGVISLGILTKSRTSLITMLVLLFVYATISQTNMVKKVMSYILISFFSLFSLIFDNLVLDEILVFMYKGQDSILYSRGFQIDGLLSNFSRNPIFGSGFAVPVTSFKSYSFSSEFIVEPGNLILSVLSYGGILGFIFFLVFLMKIFTASIKNYRQTLFMLLSPIMISMGEMVFFSTNNIGIWCYMFIALSINVKNTIIENV